MLSNLINGQVLILGVDGCPGILVMVEDGPAKEFQAVGFVVRMIDQVLLRFLSVYRIR
jgi:hypothetical protein